ncbi:tetratricopeptide repeat protein [Microbacteriaceae bacterium 4G12]
MMEDNTSRIIHLVKVGDVERAMQEAELLIKEDPEDVSGYLCLSYVYYFGLEDSDHGIKYLEEALKLDHENESVLALALDIFAAQNDAKKVKEITEIGIKNYPEDGKFYFYMGRAIANLENVNDSLVYYEKAMELDPENEDYVGEYAYILYRCLPKRKKDALKAEKRALELNPENTRNLVWFANVAKGQGNFKKARMLAEVAMQLDPNEKAVYEIYKETIVTKHKFCAFTAGFSHVLGQAFTKFCSLFAFLALLNRNIFVAFYILSIFGWLILPLYLAGWYAGSVYIGILVMYFISSRIKKKIYKEVGLGSSFDAKENQLKNQFKREREITNMARTVEKVEVVTTSTPKLSPEEIESQLASFWGKGTVFEKQPAEEVAAAAQPQLSSKEHKEIQAYSNIKPPRYNKWNIYLIVVMSLTLVFRIVNYYNHQQKLHENTMPNISQEDRQAIAESGNKEMKKEETKLNLYVAAITLHSLKTSDFSENSLRQIVADSYVPIVVEKAGQPGVEKLKNSRPVKGYQEGEIMYLLTQSDDSTFILEFSGKKVNHIYGENWDNREQEMKRYNELFTKMETQGIEVKAK